MCLKAVKIDEGHCAAALKKAVPAMIFEKNLHADNLSKCKQNQLTLHSEITSMCQKFLSNSISRFISK